MGSDSSKTENREAEAKRLRESEREARERIRILEKERTELEKEKAELENKRLLELHYHEQRRHEEARLKKVQEEWERQKNLQQQKLLQEQQIQAQMIFQQQLPQPQFQQQLPLPQLQSSIITTPNYNHEKQQLQQRNAYPSLASIPPSPSSAPSVPAPKVPVPSVPAPSVPAPKSRKTRAVKGNALPDPKPKSNDATKTHPEQFATLNVNCVEWSNVDFIQEMHGISRYVAENIVKLFEDYNTVPFIARYRKNMTLGMDADQLRLIKSSYDGVKLIKQKADAINKEIDKQGKLTAKLRALVLNMKSLNDLEHIHSMLKVTKSTVSERAKNVGLAVPAQAIIRGENIEPLYRRVKPRTKGLETEEEVRDGIVGILADMMNRDECTIEKILILRSKHNMSIETTRFNGADNEKKQSTSDKKMDDETKYENYYNFSSFENNLKPHQILAINRGQARKILNVNVNVPAQFEKDFKEYCASRYGNACKASSLHRNLLTAAFDYAWNKSIKLSICQRTRHQLTEKAENILMDEFVESVKQVLLVPPVRGKIVLGIDPTLCNGCKLALVSEQGKLLENETIYPHDANNPRARLEAERTLARIILCHQCTILALGSGTGCREIEVFLAQLIKKGVFEPVKVVYTIVDQTAAAVYSCSREASMEFPDLDINVISAVSIARRLQDPLLELVKIEPKILGVGTYRHNLPEKQLSSKLNEAIMEIVSFVGVDVNTASLSLLKRVAGLNESSAKRIIERRENFCTYRTRDDLKNVRGICAKTFEQCAGFVRILPETAAGVDQQRAHQDSLNYLDQTWIHPESYDIAKAFLNAANCSPLHIGTKSFIFSVTLFASQDYSELAKKFKTTVETMRTIVEGLTMEKGTDIRARANAAMFRSCPTSIDDLRIGTVLSGVVRCAKPFGVFVDVGVDFDGLIPKSRMGEINFNVGQTVKVKVNNIQKERGRLCLIPIDRI